MTTDQSTQNALQGRINLALSILDQRPANTATSAAAIAALKGVSVEDIAALERSL